MFIIARDSKFEKIAYDVPYTSLRWVTRWYDFGEFQMQIPVEVYDEKWAYFTSPETKRVAWVQKVQKEQEDGGTVILSGFFLEKMLDRAVILPDYRYNSESVSVKYACYDLIRKFYYGDATHPSSVNGLLNIDPYYYSSSGEPKTSRSWEGQLGESVYDALMAFGMSYEVRLFDMDGEEKFGEWMVLEGLNLSEDQTTYQPVVLSTAYGDFLDYEITFDDSGYKNTAIVKWNDNDYEFLKVHRSNETVADGMESQIFVESAAKVTDEVTYAAAKRVATSDGRDALKDLTKVNDIDVTLADPTMIGDLFNLGDIITVKIEEMGVKANIRAVELIETYGNDGKSVEVGFGNKRITNIRRATR